jgi:hypothetical protein
MGLKCQPPPPPAKDKNGKDSGQHAVGLYPENSLQVYTDMNFSPRFHVGNVLLIFVEAF